jgi:hypothetical protein
MHTYTDASQRRFGVVSAWCQRCGRTLLFELADSLVRLSPGMRLARSRTFHRDQVLVYAWHDLDQNVL